MEYDYIWARNDSDVQRMAKYSSLKSIMCNTPDSGSCMTMFQSGSKYYLWNLIEGGIWEIVTSMDLEDIVTQIAKLGLGSLEGCGATIDIDLRLILGLEIAVGKLL
jgi:hypothetical protein